MVLRDAGKAAAFVREHGHKYVTDISNGLYVKDGRPCIIYKSHEEMQSAYRKIKEGKSITSPPMMRFE